MIQIIAHAHHTLVPTLLATARVGHAIRSGIRRGGRVTGLAVVVVSLSLLFPLFLAVVVGLRGWCEAEGGLDEGGDARDGFEKVSEGEWEGSWVEVHRSGRGDRAVGGWIGWIDGWWVRRIRSVWGSGFELESLVLVFVALTVPWTVRMARMDGCC
jgi:hypothetical protein